MARHSPNNMAPISRTTSAPPIFSIVIPTLEEERCLPLLLNDLKKQSFRNFEVIHVDGGSCDQTCEIAATFSLHLRISTHCVAHQNVATQRNVGIDEARGIWTICMDADNRLTSSFLSQLHKKLRTHPQTDVFTCLIETKKLRGVMLRAVEFSNMIMLLTANIRPFAAGALIGFRTKGLPRIYFDPTYNMSEDHKFIEDAMRRGYRYRVFRQPRYTYSLRRFDREGKLPMLVKYLRSSVVLFSGQERFQHLLPEYPMLGGAYYRYRFQPELGGFLPNIRAILRRTTKRQQQQLVSALLKMREVFKDQ